MTPARVDLLGVHVSLIRMDDAVDAMASWIAERSRRYVCITGVHGVIESRRDRFLQALHNRADMVTPDGMPLVWLARRLGHDHIERVYGPDLMLALTALSPARGYRHFYYGGAPGVAERLRDRLSEAHPGLQVVGLISPPFRELSAEEDEETVRTINEARPDILWVGLSTPKQERWMAAHRERIEAPVMVGVGAAFDFLAGVKSQAPEWMRKRGLEWLFRLCSEPRRLWRRYLHIVPAFLVLAAARLASAKIGRQSQREDPRAA
ncbi:WecB/TagA/CpsF family glycosyltransferase [Hansschlegelia zhihuaiae]|uniref:Glycosyltransferase n=1 Tax=Hansschlegelia zhihuaiae TaxID=405005 RepID=A0A4V1KIJ9_9HYPH|nr:WecB/TagA/CpsF family glycosyltransferase [Hansschlegelia zhihuaiae]RXF70952.1 glycosyltransferase [Hansschlegelia zhihuaiae]